MAVTLCLLVLSAVNLCKQFEPIPGTMNRLALSGSKLFDTLMLFLKDFSEKLILKKSADEKKKQIYPACKGLKKVCYEKTGFLHMRKQRRRSAAQ